MRSYSAPSVRKRTVSSATRAGVSSAVALTVLKGIGEDDKAVPSITVAALSGQESPQFSGNFILTFTADIKSNADETTLTDHRTLCDAALVPLMSDDTAAQLSAAASDFAVIGITNRQSNERIEDRSWITSLTFEAYCAGVALT